jgi:hypothetical protein
VASLGAPPMLFGLGTEKVRNPRAAGASAAATLPGAPGRRRPQLSFALALPGPRRCPESERVWERAELGLGVRLRDVFGALRRSERPYQRNLRPRPAEKPRAVSLGRPWTWWAAAAEGVGKSERASEPPDAPAQRRVGTAPGRASGRVASGPHVRDWPEWRFGTGAPRGDRFGWCRPWAPGSEALCWVS